MKPIVACLAALAIAPAAPALAQSRGDMSIDVHDAAARVVVIPETRGDIDVRVAPGDPRLPPLQPRPDGGRIRIDGGLRNRIKGCEISGWGHNGDQRTVRASVTIEGLGKVPLASLPVITVRTPLNARVGASGAVWGEVGPSDTLELAHGGCGNWTVAPVRNALNLAVQGSGDTRARTAGRLNAAINGSGDLWMDAVDGDVSLAVHGSGDVHLGRMDGVLSTATAGSGDIRIDGGHARSVSSTTNGSGDLSFGGDAGSVSAMINGSGDVRVAHASGPVSKVVHGSGEVTVGR